MKTDLRINWLIAIFITGWVFYLLAPILTPFVAAALLAYVGDPLADRLQKFKMPRTLAVVCVFLLTFIVLALLILLIGPLIGAQVGALFDFLSGRLARGPQWLLDSGFEWLCRLLVEPRRLCKRYLIGNFLFFWYVLKWKTAQERKKRMDHGRC